MSIKIKYRYEGNFEKLKQQTSGAAEQTQLIMTHIVAQLRLEIQLLYPQEYLWRYLKAMLAYYLLEALSVLKYSCTLANSVGVIDSDYRGEIKAKIINHGKEAHTFTPGERFAQLVIVPVPQIELIESELSETERGEGGFGSTGK